MELINGVDSELIDKINICNKVCAIIAHGSSLEELERRIDEFKDFDIVWCGMNYFIPSEEILKKIGKEFAIIFDCATVENAVEYELKGRLPRLIEYLSRPMKNVYITMKTGKDNLYELRNKIANDFNERFKDKIIYGEDIIGDNIFCVTIPLYITLLIKLGADKIILFGADGGGGDHENIQCYYKPDMMLANKILANNTVFNIKSDAFNVNSTFGITMSKIFGYVPEIINCTSISNYTAFKKMNYNETIEFLKEKFNT